MLETPENHIVLNTSTEDLDFIYALFDEAIQYIKKNNYVGWTTYDKDFIQKDIANNLQFKVVRDDDILCVFSICFTDRLIWRKKENGDAIYLHRIVVNPMFKGQKQFEKILGWVREFAVKSGCDTFGWTLGQKTPISSAITEVSGSPILKTTPRPTPKSYRSSTGT